ncbi:hypothetical protein RT967_000148 [Staphylococcus pseudintermedius]|nr:hypothetical protein [Staphylococcus pseudintermedius]ELJ9215789.1 hypothetical protein [Staphylococcus pseudintermedius]
MKIKVEKEMTLPQLIQYAWDNDIQSKVFSGNKIGTVHFDEKSKSKDGEVSFGGMGWYCYADSVSYDEIFIIEVEEEITEETEIPVLVELFVSDYGLIIHTHYKTSIREAIGEVVKGADTLPKTFYILNDDYTMTLIWEDGEMVE